VKTINVTDKTGSLVGILYVTEKEDLIITCKSGVTIRTGIQDIREAGRATQGVKLIRIDEGDEIAAISQIEESDEDIVVEGVEAVEGAETTTPDTDTQASSSDDAATDVQGESDNTITN
jgi:DNA gyrase subunit A